MLIKDNKSKSIRKYAEIIRNTESIPENLEEEYIRKARTSAFHKNALFSAHLRLVISIAREYASHNETLEDLIQEGIHGLEHALQRFKKDKGVKFNTYARFWIRAFILKYFADNIRSFKVPPEISIKLGKVNKAMEKLSQILEREPSDEEIAGELGLDKDYVSFLKKYLSPHLTLDSEIENKEGRSFSTVGEGLTDNHRGDASESLIRIDNINKIKEAIKSLPKKELFVIENRYGLNNCDVQTLEEVGKRMDLSAERIRQIQKVAEARLQKAMNG